MITILSNIIPNTKDRVNRKKVDDDYATKYIKQEFNEW
jgi:hypothetical protein